MNWLLFLSQLPSNPSSLRVNVWRKLRAAGAVGIQNGVWMLPDTAEQKKFLEELLLTIRDQGASGQILNVSPIGDFAEKDILARFLSDRDEEYAEFLERSQEFRAEIEKETKKKKFTFAELEENEQDFLRLANWLEKIRKRDLFGAVKAGEAVRALEQCHQDLEIFSAEVYRLQTGGDDSESDTEGK